MDRDNVLLVLRTHATELKSAGVAHLSLFGSVARDQANAQSDIDLLAEFNPSSRISLISLGSLEQRLSSLLEANVEVSSEQWMKEPIRSQALREAIVAF